MASQSASGCTTSRRSSQQPPNNNMQATQTQQSNASLTQEEDDDGTPPILFSCKCESARPVTTLLSCLRNVSLSHTHLTSGSISAAASAIHDATTSILTAPTGHANSSAGGSGSGSGSGGTTHSSTQSHHNPTSSGFGGRGKVQYATVFVSEKSLTFQVHGVGRQSRATVDIHAGLFSEYHVAEQMVPLLEEDEEDTLDDNDVMEDVHEQRVSANKQPRVEIIKGGEFGINLTSVLECLCVLGPNALDRTSLCLSYNTHTATFRVELLESFANSGVIISNCEIPGMAVADDEDDEYDGVEPGLLLGSNHPNVEHDGGGSSDRGAGGMISNNLDYAFRSYPILARALIKSEFLKDAISELTDVVGSTAATIGISRAGLEFATYGHSTECHVVVPYAGNHPETFISLEGVDGNGNANDNSQRLGRSRGGGGVIHARNYPLHSILSAMRGLEIACETCISINANGMVAIQHQVLDQVGKGNPNFIEFIMCCLEDEYIDELQNPQAGNNSELNDDTSSSIHGFIADDETITVVDDGGGGDGDGDDEEMNQQSSQSPTRNNYQSQQSRVLSSSQQSEITMSATIVEEKENDDNQTSEQSGTTKAALFGTVANIGVMSESRSNNRTSSRNSRAFKNKHPYVATPNSSNEHEDEDTDDDEIVKKQKSRRKARRQTSSDDDEENSENDFHSEEENRRRPPQSSQVDAETELDEEGELENSLDVTATVTSSRRRSLQEEEISSSPQLMYGDTNLEGDED